MAPGHGVKGRADRFEQVDIGDERVGLVDKPRQSPFRCLLGLGPADPAEHLLDGVTNVSVHWSKYKSSPFRATLVDPHDSAYQEKR